MSDPHAVDEKQWREVGADLAADLDSRRVRFAEVIPGGCHGSWRLRRGSALRFVALGDLPNCSLVLYSADNALERYNMPDSLKAQHTARFTRGHVLMSDMGRALASFIGDEVGWHDPFGALLDTPTMERRFGAHRYEPHRNAMHRSGRDGLLTEIGKYGLTARDLIAPVNLFSRVEVDEEGQFKFVPMASLHRRCVDLRMDSDVIVAISTAPHPLNPHPRYEPSPIGICAYSVGPAAPDDFCRLSSPEAQRAHYHADQFAWGETA